MAAVSLVTRTRAASMMAEPTLGKDAVRQPPDCHLSMTRHPLSARVTAAQPRLPETN